MTNSGALLATTLALPLAMLAACVSRRWRNFMPALLAFAPLPAVAAALASNGIKTQLLGTGVWNDSRVLRLPQLQGAWFAAPDNSGFNALAQRYKTEFGSEPTRLATLSYDAVTLAAALARNDVPDRFSQGAITSVSGFNGVDGVFRFRADGTNERGLAVMEIDSDAATIISPAARSFAAG